eukprot:scaffold742_cov186-Ochromonas_danica.AAC.2
MQSAMGNAMKEDRGQSDDLRISQKKSTFPLAGKFQHTIPWNWQDSYLVIPSHTLNFAYSSLNFTSLCLPLSHSIPLWASSQGRTEAVVALMQAGADPQKPPTTGVFAGKNALMWAASQGRTAVVQLLLSSPQVKVDFSSDSGNFKGKTALMWASSQGRVEAVEALLEAGSDVNKVDNDGLSALMWAAGSEASEDGAHRKGLLEKATKGHVKVVSLLLRYEAEFDRKDKDGITAIMFAAYHGHEDAVKALINAGSNTEMTNRAGKTALQLARAAGHVQVVQALLIGPTHLNMTIEEIRETPACGWLLGILRPPPSQQLAFRRDYLASDYVPPISRMKSCTSLKQAGLDYSLYDLLQAVHVLGVQEVVGELGVLNAGSRARALAQLQTLHGRFKEHFLGDSWMIESKECSCNS